MEPNELLEMIDEARRRLDAAGQQLVRTASEIPSYDSFADGILDFLHHALFSSSTAVGRWLDRDLGWIYGGIHINAQFFSLYGRNPNRSGLVESGRLSVTFDPRTTERGNIGVDEYFAAGNNFTTFLWPVDENRQKQMRAPLEIIFSQCLDEDQTLNNHPGAFTVPFNVKSILWQQETVDYDRFVSCATQDQVLKLLRGHLSSKYDLSGDAKPTLHSCFSFLSNTARLHVKNSLSPDPRTVAFFPVNLFGERQGVFCFVFCGEKGQKYLTEEDRVALQIISDYALLSLRQVDQEISLVKKRLWLLNQRAMHALGLTHEANKMALNAAARVEAILADMDNGFRPIFSGHPAESWMISDNLSAIQEQLARMCDKFHDFARHVLEDNEGKRSVEVGQIVKISMNNIQYNYHGSLADYVTVDYTSSNVKVDAYPTDLSIAIGTIIANAVEASRAVLKEKTECVTVSFRDSNATYTEIVVRDHGSGMSYENIKRLTARMHNLEEAQPIAGHNAGYGLSVAYHTIHHDMDGDIHIDSTIGEGSTFTISLKKTQ